MMHRSRLLAKALRKMAGPPPPTPPGQRFDFDELAKDLAGGLSRRQALRRLAGGVAGTLLACLGPARLWLSPAEADPQTAMCLQRANQVYEGCRSRAIARYDADIAVAI